MIPFDLCSAPLEGTNLIEAGAGTGKTYAIAGLFLRLIVERGLDVDQILVVTYTKAATEELKTRIRQRLAGAKAAFLAERSEEPLVDCLLKQVRDRTRALGRLQNALLNFDRAAIFTIHGFCQRLLQSFAFETGQLFRSELMPDPLPLVQEAADDFWRRHISLAPYEIARFVLDKLKGPEQLASLYQSAWSPDIRILPPVRKTSLSELRPWRETAAQVSDLWPRVRADVVQTLLSPGLNARYYGKCTDLEDRPGITHRMQYIDALAAALDRWPGRYPLFGHFNRFCADFIASATKKNHKAPELPFFDLCQLAWESHLGVESQLAAYLRYLKGKFLEQAGPRLLQKKNTLNVLFFDDLLVLVQQALGREHGKQAARAMQRQYRAALVDEFQDTDPLQYDIFRRLFASGEPIFFLIGDPKQAIYSFRGADLYAYLRASRDVRRQCTLTRNWRSTPRLVEAVNTIFGSHPMPFGLEQIDYPEASSAVDDGDDKKAALMLWHLLPTNANVVSKPIAKQEAIPRIAEAVAREIAALLTTGTGGRIVAPERVAVLTRSHSQANVIKEALARCRVPAVLYSAGSVFETREARELDMVMRAAAAPADARLVRSALATDMLGARARDFLPEREDAPAEWESRWERFAAYHQAWLNEGFFTMFSRLMQEEGVKERLLPLMDGERRITNLLHLAELLHQAAMDGHLTPDALLGWFDSQRSHGSAGEETQQLRLESDAHAVRILTIHKSKGLQFDIVFCPFTWSGAAVNSEAVPFHDPGQGNRLTLALGPDIDPGYAHQRLQEDLSENLRLLYVALTRARRKCYWVWGRINNTALSAPAYLLHGANVARGVSQWIDCAGQTLDALTDADFISQLQALAQRSHGAIALAPLPDPGPDVFGTAPDSRPAQHESTCRLLRRALDRQWRIASFSSLTAGRHADREEKPDREQLWFEQAPSSDSSQPDLFSFPGGVQAGLFFHDLLEHWDFTCRDTSQRNRLVKGKLAEHRYDDLWIPVVERLLADLGTVRLPDAAGAGFCLNQVPRDARINEMAFHFPLAQLEPDRLRQLMATSAAAQAITAMQPLHGYMKGFIDMVLRHEDRYYLVDWKSNFLGNQPEDYMPERLAPAMNEAGYTLQYLIYVAALDRHLSSRLPGYDYRRHFGGVYYIFLRGVHPGAAPSSGVFFTRPEPDVVAALHDALGRGREAKSR
ncbi:MAG: exodeoxyribonuclease V subunit beta [Desulfosarcinaceae bacterium]